MEIARIDAIAAAPRQANDPMSAEAQWRNAPRWFRRTLIRRLWHQNQRAADTWPEHWRLMNERRGGMHS